MSRLPDPNGPAMHNRAIAYARLGVTELQVAKSPQITPQLRMIEMTVRRAGQPKITKSIDGMILSEVQHRAPYGPGSDLLRSWPSYLRSSDSADAAAVIDVYFSLPKVYRELLPVEAFCIAANVSPMRILEAITASCVRLGAQASTLIAAVNHPRVVEKTVEMALTDDGIEDRTTLHKATGFLPSPKGSQTNITIAQNATATSNAQSVAVPAPPPEQTIRRLVNRFNDARALPEQSSSIPMPQMEGVEEAELVPVEIETEREDSEDD